jgi:site-specific recombinase XerD
MRSDGSERSPHPGRLEAYIDSFLDDQCAAGYSSKTLAERRSSVTGFARWAQAEGVGEGILDDDHIQAFITRRPRRDMTEKERATARRFLSHLRTRGVLPPPQSVPATSAEIVAARYVAFLRQDRGLAENSILVYAPCAGEFLAYRLAQAGTLALDTLEADAIHRFLLGRIKDRSRESSRLVTVALRSLLRFLFLRGETPRDLSAAVPSIRTYRLAGVPAQLSPEEVDRVLATPDRSTTRGRRDYAILLLLARLGLRASEVMTLELGDLRWRTGEIVVRGKGPRVDDLPLLADVGRAVAAYLRRDRGTTTSRRVFLRLIPPRVGLTRPCAIDHIVRLALSRAGIPPRRRHVAHLFRHSLATRMIRHGASIPEIAEVLRHRAQSSTMIYAKVSLEALRTVARPWPIVGGAS